jgi:hypothetical protein
MPKKDTAAAVLGMLSTVGAQTRLAEPEPAPAVESAAAQSADATVTVTKQPQASVSPLHTSPQSISAPASSAPRTLRLRKSTAARLREAWLEAKRDDVLLTAQDFASDLVEDALRRRERRMSASTS